MSERGSGLCHASLSRRWDSHRSEKHWNPKHCPHCDCCRWHDISGPSMPPLIPSAITQPTKHAQELSCPSSCRFPHEDSKPQQLKSELLQKILGRKHPQMAQQAHWSACNWNRSQTQAGEGRVNGAEPGKLTEGGVLCLNPHRAKWHVVLHTHSSELKKQLEIYV